MKKEIVDFIREACKKHKLRANYLSDGDIYMIHKDGRAVQNFTTEQFYQVPRRARMSHFEPLVRIGLTHNLGEKKVKDQLFMPVSFGKIIV